MQYQTFQTRSMADAIARELKRDGWAVRVLTMNATHHEVAHWRPMGFDNAHKRS